jgi:hypothetical protein
MKTFDFYRDEKQTIWIRTRFDIQAESYEEALEKIKEVEVDKSESYENTHYWEFLEETLEEITPEENKGEATLEIHSEDTDELIYTNETKTK